MATQLGLMIQADQSRMMRDMAALAAPAAAAEDSTAHSLGNHSFSDAMMSALRSVDAQGRAASDKMAEVDSGRSNDLVGAMVMSQEASLSFSMLTQVRNKIAGAVDDLIKMPI